MKYFTELVKIVNTKLGGNDLCLVVCTCVRESFTLGAAPWPTQAKLTPLLSDCKAL